VSVAGRGPSLIHHPGPSQNLPTSEDTVIPLATRKGKTMALP